MKRILGIFMALLLFIAPAIAESTMVEGDWELISIVIEGVTYENLAQQGMSMTMRLEADGTGVQTVNGETYPCTWKEENGKLYYDTKIEGEVLGEKVDSFAEIPVTEDGCLLYGLGMILLERL